MLVFMIVLDLVLIAMVIKKKSRSAILDPATESV